MRQMFEMGPQAVNMEGIRSCINEKPNLKGNTSRKHFKDSTKDLESVHGDFLLKAVSFGERLFISAYLLFCSDFNNELRGMASNSKRKAV